MRISAVAPGCPGLGRADWHSLANHCRELLQVAGRSYEGLGELQPALVLTDRPN